MVNRLSIAFLFLIAIIILLFSCHSQKKPEDSFVNHNPIYAISNSDAVLLDSFAKLSAIKIRTRKKLSDTFSLDNLSDTFYCDPISRETTFVIHNTMSDVYNGIYKKTIRRQRINRNRRTYHSKLIFKKELQLTNCNFILDSSLIWGKALDNLVFEAPVILENNIFPNSSSLYLDEFKNGLEFLDTSKSNYLPEFVNCNFPNGLQFNSVVQSKIGLFPDPGVIKRVGCSFHSDIILQFCEIKGRLDFANCFFLEKSSLVMDNTLLPEFLDLTDTKISNTLDLTRLLPPENGMCNIILRNTDISKIKMRYDNFHLYFEPYMLEHSEFKDEIGSVYEGLLNNFKTNGYLDSFEKLDIEYREWQSKTDVGLKISDWWSKFGYQRWRIIIYTLAFILFFSVINWSTYSQLQMVYSNEKLKWQNIQYSSNRFPVQPKKIFCCPHFYRYFIFSFWY